MSLVSASSLVGGIKEYSFRGIQQLPIVLTATSLLFTITTGSVVHAKLTMGLGILMPIYTYILQAALGYILKNVAPGHRVSWTRSTGDTCNLIPKSGPQTIALFDPSNETEAQSVPSYWLMSVGFFIGYAISNAVDSLMAPSLPNSDTSSQEKRSSQAVYIIAATSVLSCILLLVRFTSMRGCEGRGWLGIILSIVAAAGAATIGYLIYNLSRRCGSRASDLFGVLSQILPASATSPSPIVCAEDV